MDFSFLSQTLFFHGISEEKIKELLQSLKSHIKTFDKGDTIYQAGDTVQALGLILSGSVNIENDDVWGNKSLISHVGAGHIFAETYACIPDQPLMVRVVSAEKTKILFLNVAQFIDSQKNDGGCYHQLLKNLLQITSRKNLELSRRILHTSSKSVRGRLISYFSEQAIVHGSDQFTIPLNRQQLADYLGVDRSALSNELSKMQKDQLLTYHKNTFFLRRIT